MSAIVFSVMQALSRIRERQETIMRLRRLDDRLLRDIGVERRNIASTVDQAIRQPLAAADARTPRPAVGVFARKASC